MLFSSFFVCYIFLFIRPRNNTPKDASVLTNYAHRGLHGNGVPENSLQAFELAVSFVWNIHLLHWPRD